MENPEKQLLLAARRGDLVECRRLLDEAGADVQARDEENEIGWSPLLLASRGGYDRIADLLIRRGAQVNALSTSHQSPLHAASWNGHDKVVFLLLKAGAEVNCQNRYKQTALHWACHYGHASVAQILLNHGADMEMRNSLNNTPLDMALSMNQSACATILQTHTDENPDLTYLASMESVPSEESSEIIASSMVCCNSQLGPTDDMSQTESFMEESMVCSTSQLDPSDESRTDSFVVDSMVCCTSQLAPVESPRLQIKTAGNGGNEAVDAFNVKDIAFEIDPDECEMDNLRRQSSSPYIQDVEPGMEAEAKQEPKFNWRNVWLVLLLVVLLGSLSWLMARVTKSRQRSETPNAPLVIMTRRPTGSPTVSPSPLKAYPPPPTPTVQEPSSPSSPDTPGLDFPWIPQRTKAPTIAPTHLEATSAPAGKRPSEEGPLVGADTEYPTLPLPTQAPFAVPTASPIATPTRAPVMTPTSAPYTLPSPAPVPEGTRPPFLWRRAR